MADIGQVNMKRRTRVYSEEEMARIIKEIIENNVKMLKLQKQIGELQIAEEKEKRKQVEYRRKEREQEETDGWIEECRKKNEKEREEREEQRRKSVLLVENLGIWSTIAVMREKRN